MPCIEFIAPLPRSPSATSEDCELARLKVRFLPTRTFLPVILHLSHLFFLNDSMGPHVDLAADLAVMAAPVPASNTRLSSMFVSLLNTERTLKDAVISIRSREKGRLDDEWSRTWTR